LGRARKQYAHPSHPIRRTFVSPRAGVRARPPASLPQTERRSDPPVSALNCQRVSVFPHNLPVHYCHLPSAKEPLPRATLTHWPSSVIHLPCSVRWENPNGHQPSVCTSQCMARPSTTLASWGLLKSSPTLRTDLCVRISRQQPPHTSPQFPKQNRPRVEGTEPLLFVCGFVPRTVIAPLPRPPHGMVCSLSHSGDGLGLRITGSIGCSKLLECGRVNLRLTLHISIPICHLKLPPWVPYVF